MAKTQLEMRLAYQKRMRELRKAARVSSNKYNARILQDGKGQRKGSMLELSVLATYRLMERAGEISELKHQAQVYFTEAKIGWRLDMSFVRGGIQWYGEAKGFETEGYIIKRNLWRVYGLGPLEVWKGNAQRPLLHETIFPKKP